MYSVPTAGNMQPIYPIIPELVPITASAGIPAYPTALFYPQQQPVMNYPLPMGFSPYPLSIQPQATQLQNTEELPDHPAFAPVVWVPQVPLYQPNATL